MRAGSPPRGEQEIKPNLEKRNDMPTRHSIIPASYLILVRDGKVLLLRRFNTGYEDGKYSLPAGHVDEGETFTGAMIREAEEEIGIVMNPDDLKVVHSMHRNAGKGNERMGVFIRCEKWGGDIVNKEPAKCDDLSWFPLTELPENIIPYVRQAIEDSMNGISYREFGWE